jgi:hypothetical protein
MDIGFKAAAGHTEAQTSIGSSDASKVIFRLQEDIKSQ